jgi:hypothetical protein
VDEHAFVATLLDLAARRYLEIEEPGDGVRIRLLYPDPSGLSDAERLVYDLVRSRAGLGQSVPLDALVPGGGAAALLRRRFSAAVVRSARQLCLSTRRPEETLATFSFMWFAVFPALWAALLPAALARSWRWLWVAPVIWIVLIILLYLPFKAAVLPHEWSTPDGRRAVRYWLGVKAYLDGYEVFHDVPPAAVVIWDRYLAYAVALGSAGHATDALAALWTGGRDRPQRVPPARPVGVVAVRRPRSVAELTAPDAVRIGMITLVGDVVVTPVGSWPREGTRWTVSQTRRNRLRLDGVVVIVFVGMCCLFPVTLVFVPAMVHREPAGTVRVTVSGMHGSFTTELPWVGKDEYATISHALTAAAVTRY